MKKFTKFILSVVCIFFLCGCEIYIYDVGDKNETETNNSSNLTQNGSGSTIITNNNNYTGFINFTDKVPTEDTSWDIIYSQVKSSVVTIKNIVNGQTSATGSGVFFAEDSTTNGSAYIFTNAHVVENSTSLEVLLSNDVLVEGTLIGYDRNEDIAVVKIDKRDDYTIATLRHTDTLKIGEEVLTIGSPIGEKYAQTATTGIISNLNIAITPDNSPVDLYLIQIDAALNPGNSGGPLFDKGGNLIGINTIKLINSGTITNIESFNYSIPISHFSLVANYLLQGTLYYRPFVSITIFDVRLLNFTEREEFNLTINHGLLINAIGEESPLNGKAAVGQVITHIEDIKVYKASDFSVELIKHAPGDTIEITICDPDGQNSKIIEITLLER